jgi:phosphate transport system substrate-binding protein
MNKYTTAIIAVIVLTVAAVGLNNMNTLTDTSDQIKIQISGSTTCLPIIEECALQYMELNPDITIFVSGGGSSAGIKATHDGVSEIGMASRDLKPEELDGVVTTTIAKDNIAIIVHLDNPINDITIETLRDIYTGGDTSVMVVTREQGSGTRSTFEKSVMDKEEITDTAIVVSSNGILRNTIAGNEVGIGYISAGYVDESVKELNVDVNIGRNLYLVTKENPSQDIQDFIDYVLSDAGQSIVEEVGFTRV